MTTKNPALAGAIAVWFSAVKSIPNHHQQDDILNLPFRPSKAPSFPPSSEVSRAGSFGLLTCRHIPNSYMVRKRRLRGHTAARGTPCRCPGNEMGAGCRTCYGAMFGACGPGIALGAKIGGAGLDEQRACSQGQCVLREVFAADKQ